jgi:hypothetical protein
MGAWTAFYVNTSDQKKVTEKLEELTGITSITVGKMPSDHSDSYLFDEKALPNYILVGKTQDDWTTVQHNSFHKLENWGGEFSKHFNCKVIITSAQTVSDAYYFALYDKGEKRREIEVCYSDDFETVNYGERFNFENEQPGDKQEDDEEVSYFFGFENIQQYSEHFGLQISEDEYDNIEWNILRGKPQKTVAEFVEKASKPWWKIW